MNVYLNTTINELGYFCGKFFLSLITKYSLDFEQQLLNFKMIYLIIWCYCLWFAAGEKHSSLQILDYSITLIPTQPGNYSLSLSISNTSTSIPSIIYCWKRMNSIPLSTNQNCELTFSQAIYRCLQINYTAVNAESDQMSNTLTWQVAWGELELSDSGEFRQVGNASTQIDVLLPGNLLRQVNFYNFYFQSYSIYHMMTGLSRSTIQSFTNDDTVVKLSYLHTFVYELNADTLITQRQFYCILYTNKIVYIFQGAAVRASSLTYFTGILTTTNNNSPFHMWGGYSYSSGHAARDMFGYESVTESFYDLYSLYAAAPFEDTAGNVGGTKNVVRISNSGQSTTSGDSPFHFIQFYRLFDTADTNGDEVIQEKIYNRFCFAAYFHNYSSTQTTFYNLSVLNNNYKHQLIDCHIPDLSVFGSHLLLQLFPLIFILFVLSTHQ